jgi:hypothetical protein
VVALVDGEGEGLAQISVTAAHPRIDDGRGACGEACSKPSKFRQQVAVRVEVERAGVESCAQLQEGRRLGRRRHRDRGHAQPGTPEAIHDGRSAVLIGRHPADVVEGERLDHFGEDLVLPLALRSRSAHVAEAVSEVIEIALAAFTRRRSGRGR